MTNSSTRIGRLAFALAALALASAGGSAAQAISKPDPTVQLARHYAHEDATYGGALSAPAGTVASPQPFAPTDAIARHFDHEDAIYESLKTASLPAATVSGNGFDRNDALIGAGATVGLVLLGAAALVTIRRSRSSGHAVEL